VAFSGRWPSRWKLILAACPRGDRHHDPMCLLPLRSLADQCATEKSRPRKTTAWNRTRLQQAAVPRFRIHQKQDSNRRRAEISRTLKGCAEPIDGPTRQGLTRIAVLRTATDLQMKNLENALPVRNPKQTRDNRDIVQFVSRRFDRENAHSSRRSKADSPKREDVFPLKPPASRDSRLLPCGSVFESRTVT
jgi:hypothetical protein